MRKKIKQWISILSVCVLLSGLMSPLNTEAAAVNDYTQWKQYDSAWNQAEAWPASQYPNASARWMKSAGCVVTSIAMLLRHYNVVTTSDVNQFNPWICNEKLKSAGAFTSAADLYWNLGNAYPGFEYQNSVGYSLDTLRSLFSQGYACMVKVNGSGGYDHYVAVQNVSGSTVTIMDPGSAKTDLDQYSSKYTIIYYKTSGGISGGGGSTATPVNPEGCLDSVAGGNGTITISGWAFDRNDVNTSLNIHVYIGGTFNDGKAVYGTQIKADKYRKDVSDAFGTGLYHGFDETISVPVTGTYPVYVYAENIGGSVGTDYNTCLGNRTVTINATDTTPPVISNVEVVPDLDGYTVTCDVTDNSGIDRVMFPTWTAYNDQDDLPGNREWSTTETNQGTLKDGKATFRVNRSAHNNEMGQYITHIYAYDIYGNSSIMRTGYTFGESVLAIDISKKSILLTKYGETYKLTVNLQPDNVEDKSIKWTSSDTSIAVVDGEGVVTAKTNGTCTITATAISGGKSAICKVTVDIPKETEPSGAGRISAGKVTGMPGSIVRVPITIENNPGIIAGQFSLGYDQTKLKLEEVIDEGLLDSPFMDTTYARNPYILSWGDGLLTENIVKTGKTAIVCFKILSDTEEEITLTLDYNSAYDCDLNEVLFTTENGSITVKKSNPGDVNGDGEVKLNDALLLRRYIAGFAVTIDESAADVNGDGEIKLNDALLLRRYVAGWEITLS